MEYKQRSEKNEKVVIVPIFKNVANFLTLIHPERSRREGGAKQKLKLKLKATP